MVVARSHNRGWPIKWTGIEWVYIDTNENAQVVRPCRQCGKWPTGAILIKREVQDE